MDKESQIREAFDKIMGAKPLESDSIAKSIVIGKTEAGPEYLRDGADETTCLPRIATTDLAQFDEGDDFYSIMLRRKLLNKN